MKHKFTERGMTGWTGSDCSMPICTQGYYEPICDDEHSPGGEGCYRCPNDGLCIGPDVCKCSKGWTGFDCKTPVCEAVATPLIKNQLMTLDQEKIKIFETDPCGMKGFYEPESVDGVGKLIFLESVRGLLSCFLLINLIHFSLNLSVVSIRLLPGQIFVDDDINYI
jgi:hypothetical protein